MASSSRLSSLIALTILIHKTNSCADDSNHSLNGPNPGSLATALVFTYLVCILSAVFILFHLIRFYHAERRGNPVIQNRHPDLVYALNAIVIFMNIFLFPVAIDFWTLECVTNTPLLRHSNSNEILENLLCCAFISSLYAWLILIVLRYCTVLLQYKTSDNYHFITLFTFHSIS